MAIFNGVEATNLVIPLPVNQLQPGTCWVAVNAAGNKGTIRLVVGK